LCVKYYLIQYAKVYRINTRNIEAVSRHGI
jgi:hypothetical protein